MNVFLRAKIRIMNSGFVADAVSALDTEGFIKLEQRLTSKDVCKYLSLLNLHYAEFTSKYGTPIATAKTDILYNLQNKNKNFLDLMDDPLIEEILMAKLNDPFFRQIPNGHPNYILNQFTARSSNETLDLHIDAGMPSQDKEANMMQLAFVLEPFRAESGCTWVVPKSHRSGRYPDQERSAHGLVPIEANSGDVLIWDSRLWHGAGENNTGRTRWAIIATVSRWWIKQSFDMTRSIPEEFYRALSDKHKALIGFCTIPPRDEHERIGRNCGYSDLKDRPSANFDDKD